MREGKMQIKRVFAGILTFTTITIGTWTMLRPQASLAQEAPVEAAPTKEELLADPVQGTPGTEQTPGGMVEKNSVEDLNRTNSQETLDRASSSALPSCYAITYSGSAGYISVQTSSTRRVAWGITMVPISLSAGRWDVDTYLNGRKTSSGFHRSVGIYIPHGNIQARKGQRFEVRATLLSATNGRIYYSVPNSCIVP